MTVPRRCFAGTSLCTLPFPARAHGNSRPDEKPIGINSSLPLPRVNSKARSRYVLTIGEC
jgi:hypothetical protein